MLGLQSLYVPLAVAPDAFTLFTLPAVVVGPWTVPAHGRVNATLNVPVGWPIDDLIHGQWLSLEPGILRLRASNSVLLLARS